MGLFSKKEKAPEIDLAVSEAQKKRIREVFNEAVEGGDSFDILYGYSLTSKFERGFVFDTNTTTFYFYIIGYRRDDYQVVLVQVDGQLQQHSEAYYIDMSKVVNVSYENKLCQVCLKYEKNYGAYGEILNIKDCTNKAKVGLANLDQGAEREKFLDFLEALRAKLEREGHKLDKWKR